MHITIVGPANAREFAEHLPREVPAPEGMGGTSVNELVHGLLDLGHRVSLITGSYGLPETWQARGQFLEVTVVPFREKARSRALDFFASERRLLSIAIAESRPDVVHANWTYEFALAALDARVAPTLVTAHDAPLTVLRLMPDPYRFFRTLLAYRTRLKIQHLTSVSPDLARRWRTQMAYRRPISVIPNPIPDLAIDLELRSATPIVLGIGNDSRLKNFRALLRAFPQVLAAHGDAQLRLIGPGLDADGPMARWARTKHLDRSVTFVGGVHRTRLARELSLATVFCHPSLEESFGNVLIEALKAELPVVAGDRSGGVPWVLFDGKAGLLVDVRKPARISEGIISAIRDPSATIAKDLDVEAELRDRYSIESVARQYLSEYSRLCPNASDQDLA